MPVTLNLASSILEVKWRKWTGNLTVQYIDCYLVPLFHLLKFRAIFIQYLKENKLLYTSRVICPSQIYSY